MYSNEWFEIRSICLCDNRIKFKIILQSFIKASIFVSESISVWKWNMFLFRRVIIFHFLTWTKWTSLNFTRWFFSSSSLPCDASYYFRHLLPLFIAKLLKPIKYDNEIECSLYRTISLGKHELLITYFL